MFVLIGPVPIQYAGIFLGHAFHSVGHWTWSLNKTSVLGDGFLLEGEGRGRVLTTLFHSLLSSFPFVWVSPKGRAELSSAEGWG